VHDRYSKLFRYLQLGFDLLVLNAAFLLAGILRFDDLRVENQEYYNYYVQLFVFMNFAWVLVAVMLNSHIFYPALEIRKSLGKLINTIIIHGSVLALLLVSLKGYYYSRLFFTYFYIAFVPLLLFVRIVLINNLRKFLSKESNARPILLLGNSRAAQNFASEIENHPEFGLRIVAWFANEPGKNIIGTLSEAEKWLEKNTVSEVYCALEPDDNSLLKWLKLADENLIRFRFLPNLGMKNVLNTELQMLGAVPVLVSRKEPLEYRHNRLVKRAFDFVFSLLVILLIFPWLFPIIAIAIKLSSKGPVFFTQKRSGFNNQVFAVIKFRTMLVNDEADQKQASKYDSRITGVGRFLRQHNLDELPQFFNVLAGHMSVVGPRPHMLNHTAQYRKLIDEFMVRHLIMPGITGLAQSRGLRGNTSEADLMNERVKADVYYLENWSFILDAKIIFETIWNMISGSSKGI